MKGHVAVNRWQYFLHDLGSWLGVDFCFRRYRINPLNAELNPIRHLLALVGAHHTVHVSGVRVKRVLDLSDIPISVTHILGTYFGFWESKVVAPF
jgi:hypothetical protein